MLNDNVNLHRVVPEILLTIRDSPIMALLDTGSEVSCISGEVWAKLIKNGRRMPTLPVTSVHLRLAMGQRSHPIVVQCLLEFSIEGKTYSAVALVVKNLIKPVILGADWLTEQNVTINFQNRKVNLESSAGKQEISFRQSVEGNPEPEDYVEDLLGCIAACSISPKPVKPIKSAISEPIEKLKEKAYNTRRNAEQQGQLAELLLQFREIFSARPGLTNKYTHVIKMHDKTPFLKRPYPVPIPLRHAVDATIKEMLELGVIKREAAAFASPMTVVKKKDNTVRVCLDARIINSKMIADCEAPPAAEELLRRFHGVHVLSTIDLRSSYWQIPLSPESRQYTAFLYNGRSYTYQVLPFGLKTAVGSFSRAMDIILGAEVREFVVNYIDDLLVASKSFEEHLEHLRQVFMKLRDANLTINLDKSNFVQSEVKFLGHILSTRGIKADPEKVSAIRSFPVPQKAKHLRAFLGLCNFYRKFIGQYSSFTQDLTKLLRKNEKWSWGQHEQACFDRVKDVFLDAVILHYPDPSKKFYVQTDSSGYGLGAELYQMQLDGSRGVIAFASKSLKGPELNYTTTEKELLGVIFALNKFRTYIQGAKLVIRTDHQALTFIGRCRLMSERLARWTLVLGQFDYTIEHVKGKDNVVADTLSRYPQDQLASYEYPRDQPIIAIFEVDNTPEILALLQDLKQEQLLDPKLAAIWDNKEQGTPFTDTKLRRIGEQYEIQNNTLIYRSRGNNRCHLAIPSQLETKVIDYHHELLGHFGATKTYGALKTEYYWPNMYTSIKRRLRSCDLCQKTKSANHTSQGPWEPILTNNIGDLVSVDFYGPLPKGRLGATYIFVVIDSFSKFVKLYPLRKATAKAAASRLLNDYTKWIQPKCVLSDHGSQFTSNTWQNTLKRTGVQPTHSSIRHPASNPSERVMRELGRIFRAYCRNNHASWVNHLPNIENCMNSVPHISTGFSPHEILFGTKPPNPLDAVTSALLPRGSRLSKKNIHHKVRENLRHQANLRSRQQKGEVMLLDMGDWVLLRNKVTSETTSNQFAKFLPLYQGPFKVVANPHPNTYRLEDPVTNETKGVYNMGNLRLYHRREE